MIAIFFSPSFCRDSIERCFTLSDADYKVETKVRFDYEHKNMSDKKSAEFISSGHFTITKYSNSSPLVMIQYLRNNNGEDDDIPGPYFLVKNESRDTLYGEWLHGYFWGTLSKWKDDKYVGDYGIKIDDGWYIKGNWSEEPPLYPDSVTHAWVGTFGKKTDPGRYRFNMYYSTEKKAKNSAIIYSESNTFRWWSDVQNWHLLTCEFEIKP